MLKKILFKMHENVCEARKLMRMADGLKESHRRAGDWYRDMALMHMQFNQMGREVARDMMTDEAHGGHGRMTPEVKAVYEDMLGDIMRDGAEVKTMIEMYKG